MARPILSEYGPDTHKIQQPRITKNGPAGSLHSDLNYSPPKGPINQMNVGVGLRGGVNYGNCGTQGQKEVQRETSGSPGSGGHTRRESGSQR